LNAFNLKAITLVAAVVPTPGPDCLEIKTVFLALSQLQFVDNVFHMLLVHSFDHWHSVWHFYHFFTSTKASNRLMAWANGLRLSAISTAPQAPRPLSTGSSATMQVSMRLLGQRSMTEWSMESLRMAAKAALPRQTKDASVWRSAPSGALGSFVSKTFSGLQPHRGLEREHSGTPETTTISQVPLRR
jgi:hypothetical protein